MVKSSTPTKRARSLIQKIRDLVAALPTEAEKKEIRDNVDEIQKFFAQLHDLIGAFPTAEAVTDVQAAAIALTEVLDRIESNPSVASLLGGRRHPSKGRSAQPSEAEMADAKSELARLRELPVDEIRQDLLGPSRSGVRLRAIAAALGIKTDARVNREAMAHQIAMSIANYRGYEQLSGQSAEKSE